MFPPFSSLTRGLRRLLGKSPTLPNRRRSYRPAIESLEARALLAVAGPGINAANYKSGVGDASAPSHMDAGKWYTVSVQLHDTNWGAGASLSVSYALTKGLTLDGKPVSADAGGAGLYDYSYWGLPQPVPAAGATVAIPDDKSVHKVRFRLSSHAPDGPNKRIKTTGPGQYVGPWVVLGNGAWSTPVPFTVGGKDYRLNLSLDASSPHGRKADPGDVLTYTVHAHANEPVQSLDFTSALPSGTTLVPGSISAGGALQADGQSMQWHFTSATATGHFQVQVNDAGDLPPNLTQLTASVSGTAVTAERDTDTGDATLQTPLAAGIKIVGDVHDTEVDGSDETEQPLDDAVVTLVNGKGATVAESATDASGNYTITAPRDGTYTLRIEHTADKYEAASRQLVADGWTLFDTQTVVLHDEDKPVQAKGTSLPVSYAHEIALSLDTMNTAQVPDLSKPDVVVELARLRMEGKKVGDIQQFLENELRAHPVKWSEDLSPDEQQVMKDYGINPVDPNNLNDTQAADAAKYFGTNLGSRSLEHFANFQDRVIITVYTLFRMKEMKQYVWGRYQLARDSDPALMVWDRSWKIGTGTDPLTGQEVSRVGATGELLLNLALLKGMGMVIGKARAAASGVNPTSPGTDLPRLNFSATPEKTAQWLKENRFIKVQEGAVDAAGNPTANELWIRNGTDGLEPLSIDPASVPGYPSQVSVTAYPTERYVRCNRTDPAQLLKAYKMQAPRGYQQRFVNPSDTASLAELARESGYQLAHVQKLAAECQSRGLVAVLRDSATASLERTGDWLTTGKSVFLKVFHTARSGAFRGYIVMREAQKNAWSHLLTADELQSLIKEGNLTADTPLQVGDRVLNVRADGGTYKDGVWRAGPANLQALGEPGLFKVEKWSDQGDYLITKDGYASLSDYDHMGVYNRDGSPADILLPNDNPSGIARWNLHVFNGPVDRPMRHGGQDFYVKDVALPNGDVVQIPGRYPDANEMFLVVDSNGAAAHLNVWELYYFYQEHGITWPYPTPGLLPGTGSTVWPGWIQVTAP
jgi:uncharacterized repeat protein (TIGR01451 family)